MQPIDFFAPQWHSETTDLPMLYIYDKGGEGDIAQCTADEAMQQISVVNVHNPSRRTILFLPVDHNIDIRKADTNDTASTCDYMLVAGGDELLIFGEIKNRQKRWIADGARQVKQAIEIFRANHDITRWKEHRAYVSNCRYWRARASTRNVEETFRRETGIRLYIQNDIHLDSETLPE